jgi:hypothetical protein
MDKIRKVYETPNKSGSFGGINAVSDAAKASQADTQAYLKTNRTYRLHTLPRKRFKRRRYVTYHINDLWQMDLADVSNLARHNHGTRFIVVCIDCFSRKVYVEPIRRKHATEVLDAFKLIIDRAETTPVNLMTDKGTEFVNTGFKQFCAEKNINFYTSEDPTTKCAIVERVIRTLKGKIYKFMTNRDSKTFVDELQALVQSYNNSRHRTIKMKPSEVTKQNEQILRNRFLGDFLFLSQPVYKFAVNNRVVTAKTYDKFRKGYVIQWNDEILTVVSRKRTIPPTYKLEDADGNLIRGSFYENELQLSSNE